MYFILYCKDPNLKRFFRVRVRAENEEKAKELVIKEKGNISIFSIEKWEKAILRRIKNEKNNYYRK